MRGWVAVITRDGRVRTRRVPLYLTLACYSTATRLLPTHRSSPPQVEYMTRNHLPLEGNGSPRRADIDMVATDTVCVSSGSVTCSAPMCVLHERGATKLLWHTAGIL